MPDEINTEAPHEEVGIIELEDELKVGDKIRIKGGTTDFEQDIDSIQIEHENVESAGKGKMVGFKVKEKVREGDEVYKL